jgi:predicted transcriptional regulator
MLTVSKADLHKLVDELPEYTEDEARIVLEHLVKAKQYATDEAPFDDEPLTAEDHAAIDEGHASFSEGRFITQEDLERKLGL